MSHEQLIQELNKVYKISHREQLVGLRLQHYSFASNTNKRGLQTIKYIEKRAKFHFRGKRILDVGCGYGGFCIEAARKGAIAHGIDVSPSLIALAEINAADEKLDGEVHFHTVDATGIDLLTSLPQNFFDLVLVDTVFEHVYDTPKLLENISAVTAPGALLHFIIPNGLCTRFIRSEGHRGIPGISIMDPSYWHYRLERHFDIYYRRWGYYAALLSYYGFNGINLLNFGKTFDGDRAQLISHLESQFEKIRKTISAQNKREDSVAQSYKEALATQIMEITKEMQYDLNSLSDAELCWKYLTQFWKGIAVKSADDSTAVEQHKPPRGGLWIKEQAIKSVFLYRLRHLVVQAVRKPGRNTVLLPYHLFRMCYTELKKRKTTAAKRPPETTPPAAMPAKQDIRLSKPVKPEALGKDGVYSPEGHKLRTLVRDEFIVVDQATLPADEADRAKEFWSHKRVYGEYGSPKRWPHFIAEEVLRFSPTSVFEFGCYKGRNLMVIRDQTLDVTCQGIDINPKAVSAARKIRLDVQLGDENTLHSLPDAAFDVCFTSSVLCHMPRPVQTLIELLRISRKACLLFEPFLGKEGKVLRNYSLSEGRTIDTTPFSYSWDYLQMLQAMNTDVFQGNLSVQVINHPIETNLGRYYRLYIVRRHASDTADKPPLVSPSLQQLIFSQQVISPQRVDLRQLELSSQTTMTREKYIERYGADVGKRRLGVYQEIDWHRLQYISSLLPDSESILDIGIGNGAFVNLLVSQNRFQRMFGIDIRKHSKLTMPSESQSYQFMYASVTNIPLKDKCINVVTCMEVLEHLNKREFIEALSELRRVSKFLLITVPYNQPEPLPSYHKLRFTDKDLLTYFPDGEFILMRKSKLAFWMAVLERQ